MFPNNYTAGAYFPDQALIWKVLRNMSFFFGPFCFTLVLVCVGTSLFATNEPNGW